MISSREDFMMQVLGCGILDLSLIDGVMYDWCDIIGRLRYMPGLSIGLNTVMNEVFLYGFGEIENAVSARISELETIPNERPLDASEEEELSALRMLEPYEDFSSFHNYIDTHVNCDQHFDTYKKYLPDALEEFEYNTGFNIECPYE